MTKVDKVNVLLNEFSLIDKKKIPLNKEGNIKFPDFFEVPEVIEVRNKIKKIVGNEKNWLMKNGFIAAGMLLRI